MSFIIGIPKEIKDQEARVALLPLQVSELVAQGFTVLIQKNAGVGAGISDAEFIQVGATIVPNAKSLWQKSQLVVKVKEPQKSEYAFFRPGLKLFCFLHLAANLPLIRALQKKKVSAFAFETYVDTLGRTPLLKPMSEIAGRLAITLGLHYLRKDQGGRGVLLSPTSYTPGGKTVVVGGGSVGRHAAELAAGLNSEVNVFDLRTDILPDLTAKYPNLKVLSMHPQVLSNYLSRADLVVGAIHVPGAKAKHVITTKMVQGMRPGSVLVDVAVDQGGCAETIKTTSLSRPAYTKFGVIHVGIPNIPALAPITASDALAQVISPLIPAIAKAEPDAAHFASLPIHTSLNIHAGKIIHTAVRQVAN